MPSDTHTRTVRATTAKPPAADSVHKVLHLSLKGWHARTAKTTTANATTGNPRKRDGTPERPRKILPHSPRSQPRDSAPTMTNMGTKPTFASQAAQGFPLTGAKKPLRETPRPAGERERCGWPIFKSSSRLGFVKPSQVARRQWVTPLNHSPI